MKKFHLSAIVPVPLVVLAFACPGHATAAGSQDAKVTQVIRDVKVLSGNAAGHAAAVNEPVREGQAVRTGGESRAELTFTDQSITRLGANTVFSYGHNAKEFDLSNGAALMVVPKEAGSVRINTAAATAAVTGFTMLVESHPKGVSKFMVLEGQACVRTKANAQGPCSNLHSGEMLVILPGQRQGATQNFDIKKTMNSSKLVKDFGKLPKWASDPINNAINNQNSGNGPGGTPKDSTSNSLRDQAAAAGSTPSGKLPPPPGTPPPR
jgi:hypothetical protein